MTPPVETKPAIKSTVLLGLAALAVPYAIDAIKFVTAYPGLTLPPPVSLGLSALGWGLALYGRLYGTNKPISGLLVGPKS